MPLVTLIAGLPGSGKSTLLRTRFPDAEHVDDAGLDWTVAVAKVRRCVREGRAVAVTDVEFCGQRVRQWFIAQVGTEVHWISFANTPEMCRANVLHRERGRDAGRFIAAIERLTKVYRPEGEILPVTSHECSLPPCRRCPSPDVLLGQ